MPMKEPRHHGGAESTRALDEMLLLEECQSAVGRATATV